MPEEKLLAKVGNLYLQKTLYNYYHFIISISSGHILSPICYSFHYILVKLKDL